MMTSRCLILRLTMLANKPSYLVPQYIPSFSSPFIISHFGEFVLLASGQLMNRNKGLRAYIYYSVLVEARSHRVSSIDCRQILLIVLW